MKRTKVLVAGAIWTLLTSCAHNEQIYRVRGGSAEEAVRTLCGMEGTGGLRRDLGRTRYVCEGYHGVFAYVVSWSDDLIRIEGDPSIQCEVALALGYFGARHGLLVHPAEGARP